MDNQEIVNVIVEVEILKDKKTAKDVRGNTYKIESITIGAGHHRKSLKYDYHLIEGCECRAEILPNGKLNIL
jgi:hypothetical protein